MERLGTFSTLFSLYLSTLHDAEFYGETAGIFLPFSHDELVRMVAILRDVYVSLHMEKHLPHGYSASRHANTSAVFSSRVVEIKPSPTEYQQLKQVLYMYTGTLL